ncbi:AAA-like domain-containing protein [Chlorogloeopsis sp. ULAP01]|uniref:AAA-like domain-containing protein n=1 Tax=Chlorogloeopsis sp. ULAP01 TaxID=3056483 RepID=UPI0025AB5764|nr:AAA-like domain-containing protein [Chlorogloeopsis sp. ULAP01]MDM9380614.1 AAA-like domain-containing protein [Chlorogloeopsis sp. ULAP01]
MKEDKTKLKRKRGVVLTVAGLRRLQAAILEEERRERGGKRFTQAELSDRIGVSTSSLSRLWSLSSRIDPRTLRICFSAFDLHLDKKDYTFFDSNDINCLDENTQEDEVINRDFCKNVGNADFLPNSGLFLQQQMPQLVSTLVCAEKFSSEVALKERSLNHSYQSKFTAYYKYPSGPLPLDSKLYISRPRLEELAYQEIMQPGCVIRIEGCREMGKTSLMLRVLAHAITLGYETVKLNLNQVDIDVLQKPHLFMKWLAASISRQLGIEFNVEKHWDEEIGSKLSCTIYLKECLLAPLEKPLLLVLDEVQHIFEYPDLAREFLPLLRSWQEEAQQDQVWQKLRLVIVYSTDVSLPLNINQSPFNLGLPLKLSEFTYEQAMELVERYGIDWRHSNQVQQLMKLIGGHPALINIALYQLCCQQLTLEEIFKIASVQKRCHCQFFS